MGASNHIEIVRLEGQNKCLSFLNLHAPRASLPFLFLALWRFQNARSVVNLRNVCNFLVFFPGTVHQRNSGYVQCLYHIIIVHYLYRTSVDRLGNVTYFTLKFVRMKFCRLHFLR